MQLFKAAKDGYVVGTDLNGRTCRLKDDGPPQPPWRMVHTKITKRLRHATVPLMATLALLSSQSLITSAAETSCDPGFYLVEGVCTVCSTGIIASDHFDYRLFLSWWVCISRKVHIWISICSFRVRILLCMPSRYTFLLFDPYL